MQSCDRAVVPILPKVPLFFTIRNHKRVFSTLVEFKRTMADSIL